MNINTKHKKYQPVYLFIYLFILLLLRNNVSVKNFDIAVLCTGQIESGFSGLVFSKVAGLILIPFDY